jgi:hypothetical protein
MRWIKSPAWDLAWVLNALWMAPLVLVLAWGQDDVRASAVDTLFFALAVPLWFGHRAGLGVARLCYASVPAAARHAADAVRHRAAGDRGGLLRRGCWHRRA